MTLLIISFIAGVLTVLAPCTFALLPVIIGSSATESGNKRKTFVIIGSLAISILVFTLVLKASTVFIMVPPQFWTILSGSILIIFSITMIFPALWERVSAVFKFSEKSNQLLTTGFQKKGPAGDIIMGAALGPVFSSCSPTYFVILASVLPSSYALGVVYLVAYSIGLALMLLLVALLGQKFVERMGWAVDPRGIFKRTIGFLFLLVAVFIFFGFDKKLQVYILDQGLFDITKVEQLISEKLDDQTCEGGSCSVIKEAVETNQKEQDSKAVSTQTMDKSKYPNYTEIVSPAGFVNSKPFALKELVGKKIILLDFMTYSCINCQRTFPYLNSWYDKYKDGGFIIIGIHTPEFAFERDIANVREAAEDFGLKFPLVLDNEYATWRAYGNNYWPHKYLIDIDGKIVYDHIGEGAYDITEMKIQDLLAEKMQRDGQAALIDQSVSKPAVDLGGTRLDQSPETYFGSLRNNTSGNKNLSLVGQWKVSKEYAENTSGSASITYKYNAGRVFLVAEAPKPVEVKIFIDGKESGSITIGEAKLYEILKGPFGSHTLELIIESPGLRAYAFTFGS